MPSYVGTREGYVLYFDRLDFEIVDNRAVYLVDLRFIKRDTGEVLIEGTVKGTGNPITESQNSVALPERLRRSTVAAANAFLTPLVERMVEEAEAAEARAREAAKAPPPKSFWVLPDSSKE